MANKIMCKKIIALILTAAIMPLITFAGETYKSPIFGKYSFANQDSYDSYKQYIGKTVMYLPCKPLSYVEKNVFKTEKFIPGAEYIIVSTKRDLQTNYIVISFQEKGSDIRLKIKSRPDYAYQLPFFFIDDFNADKANLIGKKFKDPLVKGEYIITDVNLEENDDGERFKEVVYSINNPEINRSFRTTDYKTTIENFLKEDKSGIWHSTLVKVEKPEKSSERYGDVKTVDDKGVTKFSFEDDYINIIIFGGDSHFSFKLDNKTQNSIKIVWDDAVFVDCNGSTSKVMHSGIKYNEKENPQVATTIISGASLEDIACPISNIRFDEVQKEWVTDTMYPKTISKGVKQFRLMLPIQIKEVVNEYVFIFDVEYEYNHPERLTL
jgi:hypothetical protein